MKDVDLIVQLYFAQHDFSNLSPSDFAKKYQEIYKEIENAIKTATKQKTNY